MTERSGGNGNGSRRRPPPAGMGEACGLWARTSDRTGATYFTGKLGFGLRVLILENTDRQAENEPTHLLFIGPNESGAGGNSGASRPASSSRGGYSQNQGHQSQQARRGGGDAGSDFYAPLDRRGSGRRGAPGAADRSGDGGAPADRGGNDFFDDPLP
jgi:hypothetical protein